MHDKINPDYPISPKRRRLLSTIGLMGLNTAFLSEKAFGTVPQKGSTLRHNKTEASTKVNFSRKSDFSLSPHTIHLNAAHLCPMPTIVAAAQQRYNQYLDQDPSDAQEREFVDKKEAIRKQIALSLGLSDAGEIALPRNTTEANNIIVNGYPLVENDHIVLWDQNHPSNEMSWIVRAKRLGCKVTKVTLPSEPLTEADIVTYFKKAIRPTTRLLAITHVSNLSGRILPVPALCQLARDHNLYCHVDGAQSFGILPLDLAAIGCDSFSGSAHKWLMGPREVGLLYIRTKYHSKIWPSNVGLDWGRDEQAPSGARKFESYGQRDDAALAALGHALDYQRESGIDKLYAHNQTLVQHLRHIAEDVDLPLAFNPMETGPSPIVIVKAPVKNRQKISQQLHRDYGINISTKGGIRLSPHIYNNIEDLDVFKQALIKLRHLF